ncbi:hypothetical protein [Streptomyces sp. NPDC060035]|uniref:hypothetical protein n=1 Tax=Streptomyces sp. NPDC060035 TaxID=3347044 RepID=UPI0036970B1F
MRIKSLVLSLGIAAVCTGLTGTSAAAYNDNDLDWQSWSRDTGACDDFAPGVDYCHVVLTSRQLDGTIFMPDDGGKAMKLLIYKGSKTVAQVEFHPSGEVLWVYDGANDGDTVYVRLRWDEDNSPADDATYWAPGTSAAIDSNKVQLDGDDDIDEGTTVQLRIYDDKALTDPITDWYYLTA